MTELWVVLVKACAAIHDKDSIGRYVETKKRSSVLYMRHCPGCAAIEPLCDTTSTRWSCEGGCKVQNGQSRKASLLTVSSKLRILS